MRAPRNYGDAWAKTPVHRKNGEREWRSFINRLPPGKESVSLFSSLLRSRTDFPLLDSKRTFPLVSSVETRRRENSYSTKRGTCRCVYTRGPAQVFAARQKRIRIAKAANIAKFSHHPASYLLSLRLFPRLLSPAG